MSEMYGEDVLEIVNRRRFKATRERVFEAFSDPEKLARWFGPEGFTSTFKEFDFRPGGAWKFTFHGPDGVDYENESEFVEIVRPERIVYIHLRPMHRFRMTMTLADLGGETELTWTMLLDDRREHEKLQGFIAAANEQNFDRLAAQLA